MADPATPTPPAPAPTGRSGFGDKDDHVVERRTLRDYYIALRERFWIALPLALLVAVSFGYWRARETPMYRAAASMQFDEGNQILATKQVVDTAVRTEVDLNNYLQRLRSGDFRNRVVESLTPEEVAILQRPYLAELSPGAAPPPPGNTIPAWTVTQLPSSSTLQITATHRDGEAASLIANRVVRQFIEWMRQRQSTGDEGAMDMLEDTLRDSQTARDEASQALERFNADNQLDVSLDQKISSVTSQLSAAESTLTAAQLALDSVRIPLDQVETYTNERRDLTEISAISSYPTVLQYKADLAQLQAEILVLANTYMDRHPKMIAIAAQIEQKETQLNNAITAAVNSLRNDLAAAERRRDTARSARDGLAAELARLSALTQRYRALENQLQAANQAYNGAYSRLTDIRTQQSTVTVPVSILDEAVPPSNPYVPDLSRITRTAIGLGILVFVGVAVGLSFIDDRIKSAWDVEHYVGVNLLGIIPDLSTMKDEDKYTLVLKNREDPGAESFLSVYSSVKIHSKLDFPKSILVTSTIPGEGKTLIAANIAGGFARHRKKTLLIDCDLRRPMMHRHFQKQNERGLIAWHEAGSNLEGDLTQDPTLGIIKVGDNLSLLCSGGHTRSPTEILESPEFAKLLHKFKRHYDLVIIDSPPLGAVTDSLLIAERTDEVIYVCRFNRAYRKHIRLYVKALRSGHNEILGVVLNGLSPRRIEYYSNYRYYRSYKKYYGSQT